MSINGLRLFILVFSGLLVGCASQKPLYVVPVPVSAVAHPVERSDVFQYLSCDYKSWFVSNNGQTFDADPRFRRERDGKGLASSMHALPAMKKRLAAESFVYALMSSNAYRDPKDPHFVLPGWEIVRRVESPSGLAFEEYHRMENGKAAEIVFAFKGTDGFLDLPDAKANFSIWLQPEQYSQAQLEVEQRLKDRVYADAQVTVVGHSLGGAIALNISLRQSTDARKIKTYIFNSSPRAFYTPLGQTRDVYRVAIDEKGEFLQTGRFIWFGKFRNYWPSTYNFLNFNGASKNVSEHSIYRMGRALMLVAIGTNDAYARQVFKENILFTSSANSKTLSATDYRSSFDHELCSEVLGPGPLRWEPIAVTK